MRTTTRFWLLLVTVAGLAVPVFQTFPPSWGIAVAVVGIFWALVLGSELRWHGMATACCVWAAGTGISFVSSPLLAPRRETFVSVLIRATGETIEMATVLGFLLLVSWAIYRRLLPDEAPSFDDGRSPRK